MNSTTATTSLQDEDLINYTDVTARIAYLNGQLASCPITSDFDSCDQYDCPKCDMSTMEELTALRALEEEMRPANKASGRASALRDSYLETYVRQEIDDVAGDALSVVDSYVRWDDLIADRRGEMTETTFMGTTYFILA
jgi:hypothetical protein